MAPHDCFVNTAANNIYGWRRVGCNGKTKQNNAGIKEKLLDNDFVCVHIQGELMTQIAETSYWGLEKQHIWEDINCTCTEQYRMHIYVFVQSLSD